MSENCEHGRENYQDCPHCMGIGHYSPECICSEINARHCPVHHGDCVTHHICDCLQAKLDELQKENEELKAKIKELKYMNDENHNCSLCNGKTEMRQYEYHPDMKGPKPYDIVCLSKDCGHAFMPSFVEQHINEFEMLQARKENATLRECLSSATDAFHRYIKAMSPFIIGYKNENVRQLDGTIKNELIETLQGEQHRLAKETLAKIKSKIGDV